MNSVSYSRGSHRLKGKWILNQLNELSGTVFETPAVLLSHRSYRRASLEKQIQSGLYRIRIWSQSGTNNRTCKSAKMLCSHANDTYALFSLEKVGVSKKPGGFNANNSDR